MKTILLTIGLAVTLALNTAATVVQWYSGTLDTTLPDNSAAGSTFSSGALGLSGQQIDTVNVLLNISGGYNGDLYGYLVYNDGNTTVSCLLLNRVGGGAGAVGSVTGFGGGVTTDFASLVSAGVTLTGDGSGNSIQTTAAAANTSYAAAGGGLNPTFSGLNSGGTWTLFLADLSAGDQSTLVSWGLDITVVPEPVTWALIAFAGLLGGIKLAGWRTARKPA